jgi:hypothetical protein
MGNLIVTPKTAFAGLKMAMEKDPDYAWCVHCNITMPIYDSGVNHKQANEASARVMEHLFGIRIKEHPNYMDLIDRKDTNSI